MAGNSSETMENTSEFRCQSNAGIVLTTVNVIVETILNYLDNEELIKCRLVCQLWKQIIENIMNNRIIIITKKIPVGLSKRAIGQPKLILPYLDFPQNVQFISEFNEYYKTNRFLCQKGIGFSAAAVLLPKYVMIDYNKKKLQKCHPFPSNGMIETKVAIFPMLSGIEIHHFSFSTEQISRNYQDQILNLIKLINVPKEELKSVIWFMNKEYKSNIHRFPDMQVPSILLSNDIRLYSEYLLNKNWGIALCGKRLNAVLLKPLVNETSFETVKVDFLKQMKRIKSYRIKDHKYVAFFSNNECWCYRKKSIFSLFKESFLNIPILLFSDKYLFDLSMPKSNENEFYRERFLYQSSYPRQSELILLVWFK